MNLHEFGLRGIVVMAGSPVFYFSVALYYYAVWVKCSHILMLSVLAHCFLEASYFIAFFRWPVVANVATEIDLSLSWQTVQPGFWIGVMADALHFIVFLMVKRRYWDSSTALGKKEPKVKSQQ